MRIIGGTLRSRRIRFEGTVGLRPTPDRVRETVFNWLAGRIREARCLDLFAGSGALGFEAASRGASHVTLVESNARAASKLLENRTLLGLDCVEIHRTTANAFLGQTQDRFDVIFLDPPFDSDAARPALGIIARRRLLTADGFVYVEQRAGTSSIDSFDGFETVKHQRTGDVDYRLLRPESA